MHYNDNATGPLPDSTSEICMMLRNQPIEQKTKMLLAMPGKALTYIYETALRDEHYEVCRVAKLILDLRAMQE